MARIATRLDFEPANATELRKAMYGNKRAGYREYPFFEERLTALNTRFSPSGQDVLVAGCAYGYLVNKMVDAGYEAYGLDASAWVIGRALEVNPHLFSVADGGTGDVTRLAVADALVEAEVDTFRTDVMGITGQKKIDITITEDMMSMLTDAEIPVALAALRSQTQANLLHIITPNDMPGTEYPRDFMQAGDLHPGQDPINWKSSSEWFALVSPPDVLVVPPDYLVVTE
jgi:SAM-dependent methyltransferase